MRTAYQVQDRPELLFAVKEATRRMRAPSPKVCECIKRGARFLVPVPQAVQVFKRQGKFQLYSDSDIA
eukprot:2544367-Prorocentrum_lima.AAC.1